MSKLHYRRLLLYSVLTVSLVAIMPLTIMTAVNYHQYQDAFHLETTRRVSHVTETVKLSLESFFAERLSALSLVIQERTPAELEDPATLARILRHMKRSFGGFVDLGLIDSEGQQISYAGPYKLQGKQYARQAWFHKVGIRGVHVSEVFMGHRHVPHLVIAVRHDTEQQGALVLRATIDTEMIERPLKNLPPLPSSDAFLLNGQGILQTRSRFFGEVLDPYPLPPPRPTSHAEVEELEDEGGKPLTIGHAQVERTPFVVMLLSRPGSMQESWLSLRRDLIAFLAISVVLILVVVVSGSSYMVNRTREADLRRASIFHKMEYTNKMAAIGRLAAGVAHEINNPLAIINEKAGLLRDLFSLAATPPRQEKVIGLVNSVLKSVERCSAITHRLLGFARHMDVQRDKINLDLLIKEVLGFLEKEATHRGIPVAFDVGEDIPTIESDRGQLQQVFLNILNNAFAAVEDGGHIDISITRSGNNAVAVAIADNGMGIPEENLQSIFEPFFTTKKGYGTGLGLSITYGIVQNLGGQIKVRSTVGEGTCFTVLLPVQKDPMAGGTR